MVVLGEKLGGGTTNWSVSVLEIVSGALFLRSSRVHPTLLMASERLPHLWTARRKHTCGIPRLAREEYVLCKSDFSL
jgi:hypothetical protein